MDRPWDDAFEGLLLSTLGELPPSTALEADTDLCGYGLDSIRIVRLMISLESTYSCVFPDEAMTFATFATPGDLWAVVDALRSDASSLGGG